MEKRRVVLTVPCLHPRPGVKLQLQGQMVCRLGVLLLGPQNVKVLGGEVEDLVDRNNQVGLAPSLSIALSPSTHDGFLQPRGPLALEHVASPVGAEQGKKPLRPFSSIRSKKCFFFVFFHFHLIM